MKRIDKEHSIRPSAESKAYLDVLKEQGVFRRMIDGYVFAAAYAIFKEIEPQELPSQGRQDLVRDLKLLDDDVLLSLEAGIAATYKRQGKPEPSNGKELLEILTCYAEAGLKVLKEQWENKTSSQIQEQISKIIQTSLS